MKNRDGGGGSLLVLVVRAGLALGFGCSGSFSERLFRLERVVGEGVVVFGGGISVCVAIVVAVAVCISVLVEIVEPLDTNM